MKGAVLLASASFGAIGACMTLPGSLLPVLVEAFDIRLVEAGSMLALQPIGYLLSVLAARGLIARFGARRVTSAGLLVFALGIIGFGLVSGWRAGAAVMFLSGLGFGSMEVAGNTLVLALGGARNANLLNFVHLFFGVGSLATPAVVTRAVAAGVSWRSVFVLVGAATAAIALSWVAVADPPAEEAHAETHAAAPRSRLVPLLLASILGLYVGVETGVGGWLTKFMVSEQGVALPFAGNALSAYWLGLSAGRFVLIFVAHHVAEGVLVVALSALSTAALVAAVVAPGPWLAAAAFTAAGLGYSGIFPAVIAMGGRFQPENTAAITSMLIAGAGVGGIVVPWVMSAVSDAVSVAAGMGFYAVMTGVMTALAVASNAVSHRSSAPSPTRPRVTGEG